MSELGQLGRELQVVMCQLEPVDLLLFQHSCFCTGFGLFFDGNEGDRAGEG